jgi:hypothetical protein
MNRFLKVLLTCCLVFQVNAYADTSKTVSFDNQKEEVFDLENYLKKIEMIKQEVKDTCTRKVPYQENVCRDVTKYKKECSTVPAHEECHEVNQPICHYETSMETECHNLPDTQSCHNETVPVCSMQTTYETQCHQTPDRQDCRPVSEQVCHNETRYDNQCTTVPGENQCRVVVHYRQECSQVPGGQQCTTVPGSVQCAMVNGENRCTKIPPHQECSNAPSRQECRQVPYEERECSMGPSRQECHQVPRQERVCENQTHQDCRTVPGQNVCEQVPRQNQVCHNETQQRCDTVPGPQVCNQVPRQHQVCDDNMVKVCENVPAAEVCHNVPYKENVCKMETKYKDENYECTKTVEVPKETLLKTHQAKVTVDFNALAEVLGVDFNFALDTQGAMSVTAESSNDNYDNAAIVFSKKDVKAIDRGAINEIAAKFNVLLLDRKVQFAYLSTLDIQPVLSKYSFVFHTKGKLDPKRSALALKISRKGKNEIDKKISKSSLSYKYDAASDSTTVTVDLKAEGAKIGNIFTGAQTAFAVEMSFAQDYSDAGDIILSQVRDFALKFNKDVPLTK